MSKKKLNTESITQELSGAVAAFAQSGSPARPPSAPAAPKKKLARRAEGKPPQPLARRPLGQSTGQAVDQLDGQVLDRPKAFYITRRLDRRLDEAVRYFQAQHGLKKVDRSV